MHATLQRRMKQDAQAKTTVPALVAPAPAVKVMPSPVAQKAPTAAPAARHWALPDPDVCASQRPVEASRKKSETLDRRMVATLAKIAGKG